MGNLMICSSAKSSLKLNESETSNEKYLLEGVFAELDVLNRNHRIYKKDEYLKHLQYLRNDIKKGEPLLGELDHPDDRFEVKLKEASHRVLDLWYDSAKNAVMGKIELLNTPNGKLAQSMVDQGIPLHISSRAAGSVASDNTVSIQQIYTYDLVCKPGFAGAILHRVNESADAPKYDNNINNFLENSYKGESMNAAVQYGIINENMSVSEIKAPVVLRKEAMEIQINKKSELKDNMTKSIYENIDPDSTIGKPLDISGNGGSAALGVPVADMSLPNESEDDTKNEPKSEKDETSAPSDDKTEETDEKKSEDTGVTILEVEAEFEDDEEGIDIIDVEPDEEEASDDEESSDDKEASDEEKEDTSEAKKCLDTDDANSKKVEKLKNDAKDDIKKHKEDIFKKLDDLKDAIKKKSNDKSECKCESIVMAQYPVSMMMNENNFAKFVSLTESQKNKVVAFLQDNNFVTSDTINENWMDGINYTSNTPVWLKNAPEQYKALYEAASTEVKNNLKLSAKYFIFESQRDINVFWENSGLVEKNAQRVINESFVKTMPKVASVTESVSLPYGMDFINQIAEMASEYNNKY